MQSSVSSSNRLVLYFISYLIWPFSLFYTAFLNIGDKSSRIVISFLGFYLGYSMNIISGSDGSRIGYRFLENVNLSSSDFFSNLLTTYVREDANPDFYLSTITFLISRVTSSQNVFFGILGFVYFYFFAKFYQALFSLIKENNINIQKHKSLLFILIGISFVFPLSGGINAVRFPLATYVYLYSIIRYISSKSNKFIILNTFTFLIHWSFIPLVILFYLSLFLNKFKNERTLKIILIVLFIFTSFLSQAILNSSFIKGSNIENKYESYSDENYLEDRNQHLSKLNLHIQLVKYLPYYFSVLVVLVINFPIKKLRIDNISRYLNILTVLLIIFTIIFGNEAGFVNNRFIKLSFMTSVLLLVFTYINNRTSLILKNAIFLYIPLGLLQLYTVFRTDFEVFNLATYLGNFLILNFSENLEPVIQLIK